MLTVAACTGASPGENSPGTSTTVDEEGPPPRVDQGNSCLFNGPIAVDDRTDTAFLVQTFVDARCADYGAQVGRAEKTLYAVTANGDATLLVAMNGRRAVQMLFSSEHAVALSQPKLDATTVGHGSRFDFFDPVSLTSRRQVSTQSQFVAPRVSASRRFFAAADAAAAYSPISVIDAHELAATGDPQLAIVPLPHDGTTIDASWLNHSDRLVVISFRNGGSPQSARARILAWSIGTKPLADMRTGKSGIWENAEFDIQIPGVAPDLFGSFTRVGITPDDRHAVIPVRHYTGMTTADFRYELIIVNLDDGGIRFVDDARGPVGFTPDSSTIISYRYVEPTVPKLLAINCNSLNEELLDIPGITSPQFFVTREGNAVVLASTLGNGNVLVYDLDDLRVEQLRGLMVDLHEFVSLVGRGELWLVDEGLFRLDFLRGQYERINLPWVPWHVSRLARSETLLLDDVMGGQLIYFDPTQQTVIREVDLRRGQIAASGAN